MEQLNSCVLNYIWSYCTVSERLLLQSTGRRFFSQPICTELSTFCHSCWTCTNVNPHLCTAQHSRRYWDFICSRSRGQLTSIEGTFESIQQLQHETLIRLSLIQCQQLPMNWFNCINSAKLQALTLINMHLSSDCLNWISKSCVQLRFLNVSGCHRSITTETLDYIIELPQLTSLNLANCFMLTDFSMRKLAVSKLDLKSLGLAYCYRLTDASLIDLTTYQRRLEQLNLTYCYKVTRLALQQWCGDQMTVHC